MTNSRERKKNYVDAVAQPNSRLGRHCLVARTPVGAAPRMHMHASNILIYTLISIFVSVRFFFNICWLQWIIMTHKKHLSSGNIRLSFVFSISKTALIVTLLTVAGNVKWFSAIFISCLPCKLSTSFVALASRAFTQKLSVPLWINIVSIFNSIFAQQQHKFLLLPQKSYKLNIIIMLQPIINKKIYINELDDESQLWIKVNISTQDNQIYIKRYYFTLNPQKGNWKLNPSI